MIVDPATAPPFQMGPIPTLRVTDDLPYGSSWTSRPTMPSSCSSEEPTPLDSTDFSYGRSWTPPRSMISSLCSSVEHSPLPQTPPQLPTSLGEHWSHPVRPLHGSALGPAPDQLGLELVFEGAFISNAVRLAHSDGTAELHHPKPSRYTSVPRVVENWSATDDAVGTADDCTTSAGPLLQSIPRIRCPDSMESSRSISTEAPSSRTDDTQSAPPGTVYSCPTTPWVPVPPPKHFETISYRPLPPQGTTSSLSNALCSGILPPAGDETQPALLHSLPTTPARSPVALSSPSPETPHFPLSSSSSPQTALCSPASSSPTSSTEDETQSVSPGTIRTLPPTPITHASFLPQESDVRTSLYSPWISVLPSPSTDTRYLQLEPPPSLSASRASSRLASPTPSHTEDPTQLVVPDATVLSPAIRPHYYSSGLKRRGLSGLHMSGLHPCLQKSLISDISSLSVHNKYYAPPSTSTALPLVPPPLASPSETRPKVTSISGPKQQRRTHTKWKPPARFYVVKSAHSTAPRRVPIVTGKLRVTKPRAAGRVPSPSSHSGKHKRHQCHRGCGYSTDLRGDIVRHNKTCSDGVKEFFCIGKPVDEIPDPESIVEAVEWPGMENMFFAGGCGRSYARKDAYDRHLRRTCKHDCVGDSTGAWWANEKVRKALALATAEYEAKQKARRR